MLLRTLPLLLLVTVGFHAAFGAPAPLFNGNSFDGWEGDTQKTWRIRDGVIVGGALEGNPRNEFLATRKTYKNFALRLEYKLIGTEGFVNGGVQFRSRRINEPPNEMIGYQADIGAGYSGCLYDESRRKKVLSAADKAFVEKLEKPGDWNVYEVQCEGPRIILKLNGRTTVDYTEREPGIDLDGVIALQIHGNSKAEIAYRNITIEELPAELVPDQAGILKRFGEPAASAPSVDSFADAKFTLREGDTVVFAGQTNLVREQKAGELEAILAAAFAAQRPRFRSMAWEGDTVYEQWRDINFGPWEDQLAAAGATVIVAQFGQMEALDGKARLTEFTAAYHRLLDQFARRTRRIVLLSPMPFEKPLAERAPDLAKRNDDVAAYAAAVRDIARQRGAIFVDLVSALASRPAAASRLTENGIHLTPAGLREVAEIVARELGARPGADDLAGLRALIAEKNRLWFDCWRPANWNFVYGDRATQLFATAIGAEPSLRQTFESHRPMIAELDERIHRTAQSRDLAAAGEGIGRIPSAASAEKAAPPPVAASPEDQSASPEAEQATFTLSEGYQANLFASERDGVVKPTQIAWDERGRLYVACSPTYPHLVPGAKPGDYILALEDTDGDGRADKSWRFAEGLTMVQGVEPGDGGVYVCDFNEIVHLRDTDGDGKADERRVLLSGFGTGDTHQLVNSITHGPDGNLWMTQGLHIFSRIETPWGVARLDKAGVWRFNRRTLRLDAFFNGGRAGHNCWGVAFDDFGQVFHKTGDRPDGYYTVPGMIRGGQPEEYHGRGSLFKTTTKTTSLDIVGTRALPEAIQGCAVIGGFMGNTIELHRFIDDGSGFRTEQLPKLLRSSTDTFRPVDVGVGPDGAIYAADWYNHVIGHYQASYRDPQRDKTHGRIWRISASGRPPVRQPDLARMSPAELLEQLGSPERWTRAQARRLLAEAPASRALPAADARLQSLLANPGGDERLLIEIAGVFQSHEAARPALTDRLAQASDPRVRAYGARLAGAWADQLPDAGERLERAVRDPQPRVRIEAIVASTELPGPRAVEIATEALDQPTDRFIDYALKLAVQSTEAKWKPAFSAGDLTFGGNAAHKAYVAAVAAARPTAPSKGRVIYETICLNCHQPDGKGLPGVYPPLDGSEWVAGDPTRLIKMMLHGLAGPIQVSGKEYGVQTPLPMPPSGLKDDEIADVLSYVRATFGRNAEPVTKPEVEAVRAGSASRTTPWSAAELTGQEQGLAR